MRSERERLSGDDEIDLFELISVVWQRKLTVVVTAAAVTAVAVAYAMLAEPIYEAKLVVQPPTQNDIAHLNYGRGGDGGLPALSIKDVYDVYLRNLLSESLKREFFREYYLPSLEKSKREGSQDELYSEFSEVLKVGVASKSSPNLLAITANRPNPEQAAQWALQYAQMAGLRAKKEVLKDVKADATVKANNLEQKINASKESAAREKEDQIAQLLEALKVAKSIGLDKPPIISSTLTAEVSAGMDGALTYMRGTKALEAEIENLRNRPSNDPFVQSLRQRQEALNFYRSLVIDPAVIEVFRPDGAMELPDKPIKPRRLLIVAIGGIAGLALGAFIALAMHVWRRLSRKQ